MDALDDLLRRARVHGALFERTFLTPPWSLRFVDPAPLTLLTMGRSSAWVLPDGADPIRLAAGTLAVLRGGTAYTVSDEPTTPPSYLVDYLIDRDCTCTPAPGATALPSVRMWPDGRSCGTPDPDAAVLVSGVYRIVGVAGERLLAALPPVLTVADEPSLRAVRELALTEIEGNGAGAQIVLDRLLDVLLVTGLRLWFARSGGDPGWHRALGDQIVGSALRLIHDEPAHPWTVGELAVRVGSSRATFARRFHDLVGEPPRSYLAGWRICLAADLLRDTDDSADAIARQVGYSSAFALSVAFKRQLGVSPTAYRNGAATRPGSTSTSASEVDPSAVRRL